MTLVTGLLLGAALAVALEGVGSAIRRRAGIEGAARTFDGIGGAALMGALGLLVVWAVGAVALHSSGSSSVELRAQCSARRSSERSTTRCLRPARC